MTALLLKPSAEPASAWITEFQTHLPELEVRVWPDVGAPADIAYALVANLPFGELAKLPHLRLIISLPVGLDHLLNDPALPAGVPLVRCVNPDGDPMMTQFILLHVLRHHRHLPAYAIFQTRREWQKVASIATAARRVGIMGLGTGGRAAARALQQQGFPVVGWSRTVKDVPGVTSFAGPAALDDFLAETDILVCMLPLTTATAGVLDARTLGRLPKGASVINVGRGGVLVTSDLLALLDSGHLSAATLDVTEPEPLPTDSPLWTHPAVTITPHIASLVQSRVSAGIVAENIRRLERGEPLLNPVDRHAGY